MNTKELTVKVLELQGMVENMARVIMQLQARAYETAVPVPAAPVPVPAVPVRKVTKNDDFMTVVVPYMATRVLENAANGTDCKTQKLTDIAKDYGCEDFRFFLTPAERAVFKGSRDVAGLTLRQSLVALAGAVERAGGVR